MISAILNTVGLALIFVGAGMLWWITPVYGGGLSFLWGPELQDQINTEVKRRKRIARWGFGLIAAGTAVQVVGVWVGMLC